MGGHTKRIVRLPPAAAEGAGSFDHSDGTLRDERLGDQPQAKSAPEPRAGQVSKAAAQEADLHTETFRASADKPLKLREALAGVFDAQHPDLSPAQVAHAIASLLPLCTEEYVTDKGLDVVVSVSARYERELATGVPTWAPIVADLEATRRLADYLERQVQDCRQELFGSARVPFTTLKDAAAWAEKEASAHALSTQEYQELAEGLNAGSPALRISAEARQVLLTDPGAAKKPLLSTGKRAKYAAMPIWLFPVGGSERLAHLSDSAQRLAAEVGIAASEATCAILSGRPAAVRAWQVDHLPRAGLPFRCAIEIRDPQLSYQEVRQVFGTLTRVGVLTPTTSSATQRQKLERLYEFVVERRERQSPPATWHDILSEWNAAHPQEQYTLSAIQRAFKAARMARGEQKPPMIRGRRRKQPTEG
jgi:hypothetical protein